MLPRCGLPVAQVPDGVTVLNVRLLPIVWIARTVAEPHGVGPSIQEQLQAVSGGLPVARIRSMGEVVSESTARARFDTLLMGVFAVSALLLATVGVYGLVAYSVAERTQEIGIRIALGATPGQVRRMIITQGLMPVVIGIAIGMIASWGLGRVLASTLFGITPRDPMTFVSVAMLFAMVALVAMWRPALRATRIPPMRALRYE